MERTLEVLLDLTVGRNVVAERRGRVERRLERLAVGKRLEDLLGLGQSLVERLLLRSGKGRGGGVCASADEPEQGKDEGREETHVGLVLDLVLGALGQRRRLRAILLDDAEDRVDRLLVLLRPGGDATGKEQGQSSTKGEDGARAGGGRTGSPWTSLTTPLSLSKSSSRTSSSLPTCSSK